VLRQFEDRWQAGPPPRIEDFLPADGAARSRLLIELIHLDFEYRR
jgi:hypothetical protein